MSDHEYGDDFEDDTSSPVGRGKSPANVRAALAAAAAEVSKPNVRSALASAAAEVKAEHKDDQRVSSLKQLAAEPASLKDLAGAAGAAPVSVSAGGGGLRALAEPQSLRELSASSTSLKVPAPRRSSIDLSVDQPDAAAAAKRYTIALSGSLFNQAAADGRLQSLDDLTAPCDSHNRCLLHYAAAFDHHRVLTYALESTLQNVKTEFLAKFRRLKASLLEKKYEGTALEVAAREKWAAEEEDRLERQFQLALEEAHLNLLRIADADHRTLLHYAASARGTALQLLADSRSGADFTVVSKSGVPLFHRTQPFCSKCGLLIQADDHARSTSPIKADRALSSSLRGSLHPVSSALSQSLTSTSMAALLSHTASTPRSAALSSTSKSCRSCGGAAMVLKEVAERVAALMNTADDFGGTPLHYASFSGDIRAVTTLLKCGANRELKDSDGALPVHVAANRVVRTALLPIDEATRQACVFSSTTSEPPKLAQSGLRTLVASGEDVNTALNVDLRTPLHLAATNGELEVVKYLVAVEANVNAPDANGWTPLHCAANGGTLGHVHVAEYLVASGANIQAITNKRASPLHLAALQAFAASTAHSTSRTLDFGPPLGSAMIDALITCGAKVDAQDDELCTPLHVACKKGRLRVAVALIEAGASLTVGNKFGCTALHIAVLHAHTSIIRLITRSNCETGDCKMRRDCHNKVPVDLVRDMASRTALNTLFEAAASGSLDSTQAMVVASSASSSSSERSVMWQPALLTDRTPTLHRTALHCVISGCVARCMYEHEVAHRAKNGIKTRLAHGATVVKGIGLVKGTLKYAGKNALGATTTAVEKQYALVAGFLLRAGVIVDDPDADGVTALMLAARHDLVILMGVLLQHHANVHATDLKHNTALHYAYAHRQTRAANLLESYGADSAMANDDGKDPAAMVPAPSDSYPVLQPQEQHAVQRAMRLGHRQVA